MHIAEGVLSGPILATGAVLATAGVYAGLRSLKRDQTIMCGVMAAVFFVGSLIHVPLGPGNAHLVLNGLLGVFLGWAAFPAILLALALQAILFQFGGITTLGVNTFTMGSSAVLAGYIFRWLRSALRGRRGLLAAAFCSGFCGVAMAALLTALALAFTSEGFRAAAYMLFIAHIPIMVVEGLITSLTVGFVYRISPDMLWLSKEPVAGHKPDIQTVNGAFGHGPLRAEGRDLNP